MISDERTEKAVEFIRDNAEQIGQLRGRNAQLEHLMKVTKAQVFLRSDGTVAERQAMAEAHPEYVSMVQEYRDCVTDLETKLTLMKGAELTIEVWRTQAANMRRTNI